MGRQDKDRGLWSFLCGPGLTAPRRSVVQPRAGTPRTAPLRARCPHPGGPFAPRDGLFSGGADLVGFVVRGPQPRRRLRA